MEKILWNSIAPGGEALHVRYASASESGAWKLHGHDFYEVFWVDSGMGRHVVHGSVRKLPLRPGHLVFIRSGDIHTLEAIASAEPFALINVAFPSPAWTDIVRRYGLQTHPFFREDSGDPPTVELAGAPGRLVSAQFRDLIYRPRSALVRDGFLLTLARLVGWDEHDPETEVGEAPAWLRRALLMAASDADILRGGVKALARLAGYSQGHLSRTMRHSLGRSPTEWIMERRLRRSERLLETAGLSVADVASEAGFENLSHFHRCFKSATGRTPLRFRRERARTAF